MKHFIIGTAGHVDHGKTMLVKALTGKETDRLKEEKERGISIELGFAPFRLPSGILAGIVDVPGHERFIKNMLAGVGGMDLVLLVVAADEGVMPQTTEHLDIIRMLQVPRGAVVITKADLVEPDWLEMVREEVREAVRGSVFAEAPMIHVSAVTGEGIPELTAFIDEMARQLTDRESTGKPRMAIDRVFSITGFGTVVTGTLLGGPLNIGDTVEILPQGLEARIRNIQVHGSKVETAEPGQRTAVNLAGVEIVEIDRGSVLAAPGTLKPSHRLDVRLELLAGTPKPLANRSRVRVHIGTAEILARVILLDREELAPGESALAQLECEEPMVAARGDRFVIRSYSPMTTIGGGTVVDPLPAKHKRFREDVIAALATMEQGTPAEIVGQYLRDAGTLVNMEDIIRDTGYDAADVREALSLLEEEAEVKKIPVEGKDYFGAGGVYRGWVKSIQSFLAAFHEKYPLRPGWPKEEMRSKIFAGMPAKVFQYLLKTLEADGEIKVMGDSVALFDFTPTLTGELGETTGKIDKEYLEGSFQPPDWQETARRHNLDAAMATELLNYLVSNNRLVKLEENVFLHSEVLTRGKELITGLLRDKGEITLAEARDLLDTSRKYALPLLNYLDRERITRRIEDKRVLY
ncbi:MAG: selenocysteine-specific translation elongation factor [Bacillota bacterium]